MMALREYYRRKQYVAFYIDSVNTVNETFSKLIW